MAPVADEQHSCIGTAQVRFFPVVAYAQLSVCSGLVGVSGPVFPGFHIVV